MLKITHTYLTNVKATGEAQNISCGEGLVLRVSPKGKKSWHLRYDTISTEGKRKQNVGQSWRVPGPRFERCPCIS